jgi:hypothetical protein
MKYIKLYETLDEPQIGDYVYCQEASGSNDDIIGKKIDEFLENNIGQIIKKSDELDFDVIVKYENVPVELKQKCFNHDNIVGGRRMDIGEIVFWDKDPEMVRAKINAEKYNI